MAIFKFLARMLLTELVIPLLKKGVDFIVNWFSERRRKKKLKAEIKKKVKDYEESNTVDSNADSFSNLP